MMAKQTNCKASYIVRPSPSLSAAIPLTPQHQGQHHQQILTSSASSQHQHLHQIKQHHSLIPRPRTTLANSNKHNINNNSNNCHNDDHNNIHIYSNTRDPNVTNCTPAQWTPRRSSCQTKGSQQPSLANSDDVAIENAPASNFIETNVPKSKRRLTYNITDTLAQALAAANQTKGIPEISSPKSGTSISSPTDQSNEFEYSNHNRTIDTDIDIDDSTEMIGLPHYSPSSRLPSLNATYTKITHPGESPDFYRNDQRRPSIDQSPVRQQQQRQQQQQQIPRKPIVNQQRPITPNHVLNRSLDQSEEQQRSSTTLSKGPSFLFGSPQELCNQQQQQSFHTRPQTHHHHQNFNQEKAYQTKIAYVSPALGLHNVRQQQDETSNVMKSFDEPLVVRIGDRDDRSNDKNGCLEPPKLKLINSNNNDTILTRILNDYSRKNGNSQDLSQWADQLEDLSRHPVFEAFIMTGDSMVKLSSNESDKPSSSSKVNSSPSSSSAALVSSRSAIANVDSYQQYNHDTIVATRKVGVEATSISDKTGAIESPECDDNSVVDCSTTSAPLAKTNQLLDLSASAAHARRSVPSLVHRVSNQSSLAADRPHAVDNDDDDQHHPIQHIQPSRHEQFELASTCSNGSNGSSKSAAAAAVASTTTSSGGNNNRADDTNQNRAGLLHSAISHDDILVGPIPGAIRLQQSHFSSTPSMPRSLASTITTATNNAAATAAITTSSNNNYLNHLSNSCNRGHNNRLTGYHSTSNTDKEQDIKKPMNVSADGTVSTLNGYVQSGVDSSSGPSKLTAVQSENNILCHDDTPVGSHFKRAISESNDCGPSSSSSASGVSVQANDRASARRLAKRLYTLSGFSKQDVCHHLSRNEPFSQIVVEEYLQLFNFGGMNVDRALREFLSKLQLGGETQERERILCKFSHRYYDCNRSSFAHPDAVQTLVCALVLLNMDLHDKNNKRRKKLSVDAFIAGLNDSTHGTDVAAGGERVTQPYTFPRQMLVNLYDSIKKKPLKFINDVPTNTNDGSSNGRRANTLPMRRYASGGNGAASTLTASARKQFTDNAHDDEDPTNDSSIEFKSGFLTRKRVLEANGKPTAKGRRGWKRMFVTLRDLVMFMSTDDNSSANPNGSPAKKSSSWTESMKNLVKIHHAYATKAVEYTKRDHVFILRAVDQSELLFQASDESEMNSWIEAINFAAACLSAPVLPSAVSSNNKKRSRPLYPSSCTRLAFWEQLIDHDERLQKLKAELEGHLSQAPAITKKATKRARAEFIEKLAALRLEIQKYEKYSACMRKRSNSPEAALLSKHSKSLSNPFKPIDQ